MNTTKFDHDNIEEEERLIYIDFDSVLDNGLFHQNPLFKIIALDKEEPFLQIGTQMYSGKWLDSVGTHIFFESEVTAPASDPVFSETPNNLLKYRFKTRKCLELSRIFINQKERVTTCEVNNPGDCKPNSSVTELPCRIGKDVVVEHLSWCCRVGLHLKDVYKDGCYYTSWKEQIGNKYFQQYTST